MGSCCFHSSVNSSVIEEVDVELEDDQNEKSYKFDPNKKALKSALAKKSQFQYGSNSKVPIVKDDDGDSQHILSRQKSQKNPQDAFDDELSPVEFKEIRADISDKSEKSQLSNKLDQAFVEVEEEEEKLEPIKQSLQKDKEKKDKNKNKKFLQMLE